MLTEFAVRGVNLTRIESRPTGELLGRYCFSVDCEGHVADARVGDALAALRRICADVRYLGSYPRGRRGEHTPLPPGRDDTAFADGGRLGAHGSATAAKDAFLQDCGAATGAWLTACRTTRR